MWSLLLLSMAGAVMSKKQSSENFMLPSSFEGLWKGAPFVGVIGPFAPESFEFSISKAPNGDYLFEDNLLFDNVMIGYQRFYVEGSGDTSGTLWYCGALSNFSNTVENAGSRAFIPHVFPSESDHSVTFCLDSDSTSVMFMNPFKKYCQKCDCANWTLSIDPVEDTLSLHLVMGGVDVGSNHLWSDLKRIGPPPVIQDSDMPGHGSNFSCEFEPPGRDSTPVVFPDTHMSKRLLQQTTQTIETAETKPACPYMQKRTLKEDNLKKNGKDTAKDSNGYDYCYSLNDQSGYHLQWTLDNKNAQLHCAISAPQVDDNTYVAIGFRPMSRSMDPSLDPMGTGHHNNFGMIGADIVAGSIAGGIRVLYAAEYTGAPSASHYLVITNATVNTVNGRVVLEFVRPLVGGFLNAVYHSKDSINTPNADILWAVGSDIPASGGEAAEIDYHYNARGMRLIDWSDPTVAMADSWSC